MGKRITLAGLAKSTVALFAVAIMLASVFMPAAANAALSMKTGLSAAKANGNMSLSNNENISVSADNEKKVVTMKQRLTKNATKAAETWLCGDATMDNKINTGDATTILKFIAGSVMLTEKAQTIADANKDGKLNTGDATYILRILVDLAEQNTIVFDFEATEYNVTYSAGTSDTVKNMPENTKAVAGSEFTISTLIPERTGYIFLGWFESEANKTYTAGVVLIMPAADVSLVASWQEEGTPTPTPDSPIGTVSVIYNKGCDDEVNNMPQNTTAVPYSQYVIDSAIPERANYKFECWLYAAKSTVHQPSDVIVVPETDLVLTAQWTLVSEPTPTPEGTPTPTPVVTPTEPATPAAIIYDKGCEDEVTGMPENTTSTLGAQYTIAMETPQRIGYAFIGWMIIDNMDDIRYQAGDIITVSASELILTAQWIAEGEPTPTPSVPEITVNVVFTTGTSEEVTNMPQNTTAEAGSQYIIPEMIPERMEYTFLGWYYAVTSTILQPGDTITVPETDITLTASWKEGAPTYIYTITYASGVSDGSVISMPVGTDCEAGSVYTISSTIPSRSGFEFTGWMNSMDSTVYQAGQSFVMPQKNVTLTATWTPRANPACIITFNFKDEINNESAGSATAEIYETTTFTKENIPLPDGYLVYEEAGKTFSKTVNVSNGQANPSKVDVPVYMVKVDQEGNTYIGVKKVEKIRDNMAENFILMDDVVMPSTETEPIGWTSSDDVAFTGIFDGNGKTISNFVCSSGGGCYVGSDGDYHFSSNVGLFAINEGTIKNVSVLHSEEAGAYGGRNVGILCGRNEGIIENCFVYGYFGSWDLTGYYGGSDYYGASGGAGSIAGSNGEDAIIRNCSAHVAGIGYYFTGGICGKNFGTIENTWCRLDDMNSAATDDILTAANNAAAGNGNGYVGLYIGGFVGGNKGTIKNCYMMLDGPIYGYDCVGGLIGYGIAGSISSSYIAGVSEEAAVNGCLSDGWDIMIGYNKATAKTNVYDFSSERPTTLPAGFSADVWTFADAEDLYGLLELIDNPRPEQFQE